MSHATTIQTLRNALDELRQEHITIAEFCRIWRAQAALIAALPPRYGQVMEDLLGRLESGSLFAGESCSFSQEDLRASLSAWLDKATQTTQANHANS